MIRIILVLLLSAAPATHSAEGRSLQFQWNLEASLLWGGTIGQVSGNYRLNSQPAPNRNSFHPDGLFPWDAWVAGNYSSDAARASDMLSLAALTPIMLFGSYSLVDRIDVDEFAVTLLVLGEAALLNSAVNLWVRSFGLHPRPYVLGEKAPRSLRERPEANGSFYSGHASAAFMTAVFTGYVHQARFPDSPWNKWIWAGGLGTATAISTLRVVAGKHYPSDVLVGAAVGSFFGFYLPYLHLPRKPQPLQARISPLPGGLALSTTF